jgi:hypothetical protein
VIEFGFNMDDEFQLRALPGEQILNSTSVIDDRPASFANAGLDASSHVKSEEEEEGLSARWARSSAPP